MTNTTRRKWLALFSGTVLAAISLGAQTGVASASFDSLGVETGDPCRIQIRTDAAAGAPLEVDLSAWNQVAPRENIYRQSAWNFTRGSYEKEIILLFFDPDTLTLPPLPIALQSGDTIYTNALEIAVWATPAPADLREISDIRSIYREETRWTDYLYWAGLAAALAAIVFFLYRLAVARPAQPKPPAPAPAPHPHETAFRRLDELTRKRLWEKGLQKEYAAELTHILREYLERRYSAPVLESTTEQIPYLLRLTDFPESTLSELSALLQEADLVKFAKGTPAPGWGPKTLQWTYQFIRQTAVAS